MKKHWSFALSTLISASLFLSACGGSEPAASTSSNSNSANEESKHLVIGATAGPYGDMVKNAIAPILEKKGYTVETKEFNDYVQPNLALASGDLDANLFQNEIYLKRFAEDKKLDLIPLIKIPTAPMGLYSNKFKSIEEITEGATAAVPNDPTNIARGLQTLEATGLITIKAEADPIKISEKDIAENKKNLKITPVEAAQLPRALDGQDISLIPGNFALAAKMDLTSALILEQMPEHYINLVAIKTADQDKQFVKDLKEAIESPEFEEIADKNFPGFFKPEWMKNRQ